MPFVARNSVRRGPTHQNAEFNTAFAYFSTAGSQPRDDHYHPEWDASCVVLNRVVYVAHGDMQCAINKAVKDHDGLTDADHPTQYFGKFGVAKILDTYVHSRAMALTLPGQ